MYLINDKCDGSIRTARMKMRYQVRYSTYFLYYRKGADNTADYLSRHAREWVCINQNENDDANDS